MDKLSKKPLYSIAECPSCRDVYTDPRTLPCVHTVCLECITKWNESKHQCSQEDASCPLCQKEFVMPAKGFQSLPKNTFITKMLSVVMIANGDAKRQPCDTCLLNEKIPGDRKPFALTFCFDCQERLCDRCNDAHSTLKATRSHKTTVLGEKMDNGLVRCPPTRCDEHPDDELKVVCLDCQTTLCMVCCVTKHGGHQTADVIKIAEEYHTWLLDDVSSLRNTVDKFSISIDKLEAKKANIVEQVKAIEDIISKTAEHLKSKIDRNKEQLLAELGNIKSRKLREDETTINKAIENKSLLESLMNYCQELLSRGSSSDITMEAKRLHGKTAELMKAYENGLSSQTISPITLQFNPATDLFDRNANDNLVGSLLYTRKRIFYCSVMCVC
jgi:RING-type zinc-finger/B-box zinc finger